MNESLPARQRRTRPGPALRVAGRLLLVLGAGLAAAGEAAARTVTVKSISLHGPARTYGLGDRIQVRVVFSENVEAPMHPTVALQIGARTREAVLPPYAARGATDTYVFEYRVQAADIDADGVGIPANAISEGRDSVGIFRSSADWRNVFADLSHGPVAAHPFFRVDGSVVAVPKISRVDVERPQRIGERADAYDLGAVIGFRVAFDKAVRITGRPRLRLDIGETARHATYAGLSDDSTIALFTYAVRAWDADGDGLVVPADALTLNGGTITLQDDSGTEADLAHDAKSGRYAVDGRVAAPPRLQAGVRLFPLSRGVPPRHYRRGDTILMSLDSDRAVRVSGAPELALRVGAKARRASFHEPGTPSVYGADSLIFKYVVQADDVDADGFTVAEDPLVLGDGAITLAGDAGVEAELAEGFAGSFAGSSSFYGIVDGSSAVAPGVFRVEAWGRPASGGRYGLGEPIRVRVCFDSLTAFSGQPRLGLDLGGRPRQAFLYSVGATGPFLSLLVETGCNYFRHVVQADDADSLGMGIPGDALSVEGGSFTLAGDGAVAADLSHAPVGFADQRFDHKVDGSAVSAPRVTAVAFTDGPSSGGWYGAGETIRVRVSFDKEVAVTGEPRLELNVGGGTRYASLRETGLVVDPPRVVRDFDEYWQTLDGEHFAAYFDYVVQPGDLDADGIAVPANALSLNGGSLNFRAAPGVAADLSHAAVDRDPWRPVDGGPTAGYADCDPWLDPGPAGVHAFGDGYVASACVEYDDGGATAKRRASDYRLESDRSALFWFFERDNAEILLKVLDGCAVNGHRWVFAGPVTDLAFNLEVMELSTGKRWRYRNPAGRTASPKSDTTAFPCDPEAASGAVASLSRAPGDARSFAGGGPFDDGGPSRFARAAEAGAETDCEPGGASLTLSGGYKVAMCYETAEGRTGDALDFGLDSTRSGLLYFFEPDNAEVLIKVLDGCGVNGHRWVFAAPVTDLAFNLHVEGPDGRRWTHRNRLGQTAASASDLSFFPCAAASGGAPVSGGAAASGGVPASG